jgi:hypothetical protein
MAMRRIINARQYRGFEKLDSFKWVGLFLWLRSKACPMRFGYLVKINSRPLVGL